MLKNAKPVIVLTCICLIIAALLAAVNTITDPIITGRAEALAQATLREVLPDATSFEQFEITENYPTAVKKGYKSDVGYVFEMSVNGWKPGLVIMCGIGMDGKVVAVKHTQTSDTYNAEPEFNKVFTDRKDTLATLELVLSTGATKAPKTAQGYYDAIRAALLAFDVATKGSADLRSPEEILQDDLNAALGTEGKSFVRWFSSWSALGECKVYQSDAGVVIDADGSYVAYPLGSTAPRGEHSAEILEKANATFEVYSSATAVDLSSYTGIGSTVKSVYLLSDGSYMLSLSAQGYEWADAPIVIELIVDAEGKISSCVTVSHGESGGYGAACGEPEYYEQYVGKDSATYGEVPNIEATSPDAIGSNGGATETSTGYKRAIQQAFAAIQKIKGGN